VSTNLAFIVMSGVEVGEAEVRMVDEMYKETTAVVSIDVEIWVKFGVELGLKQGSAFESPGFYYGDVKDISAGRT